MSTSSLRRRPGNPLYSTIRCESDLKSSTCCFAGPSVLFWSEVTSWFDRRKADYYRYLAEFKAGNERKEVAEQSLAAYQVQDSFICLSHICILRFGLTAPLENICISN